MSYGNIFIGGVYARAQTGIYRDGRAGDSEGPQVQQALAELDDPEDREDLVDALMVIKRIQEGKEKTYTLDEVKKKLGF